MLHHNAATRNGRRIRMHSPSGLDQLIPIGERHFRRAVREFVEHYDRIRRRPRLGGLLNYYDRAA